MKLDFLLLVMTVAALPLPGFKSSCGSACKCVGTSCAAFVDGLASWNYATRPGYYPYGHPYYPYQTYPYGYPYYHPYYYRSIGTSIARGLGLSTPITEEEAAAAAEASAKAVAEKAAENQGVLNTVAPAAELMERNNDIEMQPLEEGLEKVPNFADALDETYPLDTVSLDDSTAAVNGRDNPKVAQAVQAPAIDELSIAENGKVVPETVNEPKITNAEIGQPPIAKKVPTPKFDI